MADTPAESKLSVKAVHDASTSFAFQQNAIPLVREVRILNGPVIRKDVRLRITSSPAFTEPFELRIASLAADEEHLASHLDITLNPDYLLGLKERVAGILQFEIFEEDVSIHSQSSPIALLAMNEWCGLTSLPEILAAFVLPNDPAVMQVLGRAADLLRENTGRAALSGYQDKSRQRAMFQLAAIYAAVMELRIRYIVPPASFESSGQKIRFPSEIVGQKFGTCLDLTLFIAACCEQSGLNPLVMLHQGHAYVGCWLEERTLNDPAVDDSQQIRKLVELENIAVVETTLVTSESPASIQEAERRATVQLGDGKTFRMAVDIRRCRTARIRPLPVPGEVSSAAPKDNGPGRLIQGVLDPRTVTEAQKPEPPPETPATRIDQWKSRLLDLTLRNRLLNFRPTNATIPILASSAEALEDQLSANVEMSLLPKPRVMGEADPRSEELYGTQNQADALTEHLQLELAANRIHTGHEPTEHSRRLTELFRAARTSLEENGTNTLYLAIGILEWTETDHSDRVLRAPILLVPVEIKRRSVIEGFTLRRLDEETRLNVTLMEMLRQQFEKEIPGLDPLPEDQCGADVGLIFRLFREAVRDMKGWEVKPEVWLGQFTFNKFLLWKDLSDRLEDLLRNRVVAHLVNGGAGVYQNSPGDIEPTELDQRFHPKDVFCPRSVDSSQLAAVMAAAAGHDFVLEGPPGTGKSQTITNIIAHCLAMGKRVLFVAEKRVALEAVYKRLRSEGLEPFCLELHSNKSGKTAVLEQFRRSLDVASMQPNSEWALRTNELQSLREELNSYTELLHWELPCGLTPYRCLDYLIPRQSEHTITIMGWPGIRDTTAEQLEQFRVISKTVEERRRAVSEQARQFLEPVERDEWSPSWAETMYQLLMDAKAVVSEGTNSLPACLNLYGLNSEQIGFLEIQGLLNLQSVVLRARPVAKGFLDQPWAITKAFLEECTALCSEREQVRRTLQAFREEAVLALDIEGLQERWERAQQIWWGAKWFNQTLIRLKLKSARRDGKWTPLGQVESILADALRLKAYNKAIADATPAATGYLGPTWKGGEIASTTLNEIIVWGSELESAIVISTDGKPDRIEGLRTQTTRLILEPAALREGTSSRKAMDAFAASTAKVLATFASISEGLVLAESAVEGAADFYAAFGTMLDKATSSWPEIRRWCAWRKARKAAVDANLGFLTAYLEQPGAKDSGLPELFERSFRRTLFFAIIEAEPILRDFFGEEHVVRIAKFRELDDKIASLTRNVIRARLAAGIPRDDGYGQVAVPKEEIGLLRKEIGKKTRHIPVRQLLGRIPNLLSRVKPCLLMSPLSVAQYLDPSHTGFDLVVFDEASQIPVWDAVGAIARGAQLVVVGDPKQLPPTNFFGRDTSDEEMPESGIEDLESILDELIASGMRHKRLQWHYRSRNEGLITFSNRYYYNNGLMTFPSADFEGGGVRFVHLPNARYDKGRSRTNVDEARALVTELVKRLRDKNAPARSYGVVTFNLQQQDLIENLLDAERRKYPEIEVHFGDSPPLEGEAVFVKNLESVQGDERDVIFFSICYGPDETGTISMNFGPLNKSGGERRLNVAVTRAKHEVVVFSSLRGDHIDLTRTRSIGVRDLKHYLEYAERGPSALISATRADPLADAESEFERLVAAAIRTAGYTVHHQVGCSSYRIDLGIVDPATPGRYLLGVECDGATYHRAATARDRDKLRQAVLEDLGWKLHRIWSTDWWHNPKQEMQKLLSAVEALKHEAKEN